MSAEDAATVASVAGEASSAATKREAGAGAPSKIEEPGTLTPRGAFASARRRLSYFSAPADPCEPPTAATAVDC